MLERGANADATQIYRRRWMPTRNTPELLARAQPVNKHQVAVSFSDAILSNQLMVFHGGGKGECLYLKLEGRRN